MEVDKRNGPGSHVSSETSRHRPPTALKLGSEDSPLGEHTLSKFCRDPCPVRRGLVAAVMCCVRKARFFLCRQRTEMTHHYRRQYWRVSAR